MRGDIFPNVSHSVVFKLFTKVDVSYHFFKFQILQAASSRCRYCRCTANIVPAQACLYIRKQSPVCSTLSFIFNLHNPFIRTTVWDPPQGSFIRCKKHKTAYYIHVLKSYPQLTGKKKQLTCIHSGIAYLNQLTIPKRYYNVTVTFHLHLRLGSH